MSVDLNAPKKATWPVALVIALLGAALITYGITWVEQRGDAEEGKTHERAEPPNLKDLRLSSTNTTIKAAPKDPAPGQDPSGLVVHPERAQALWTKPNGKAFAKLTPEQFGDAWFPVVAKQAGWVQVLLPSRPNGSTGWLRSDSLTKRTITSLVRVHLGSRTLEIEDSGTVTGTWSVAVGAADTPTPTGRTFILGQVVDSQQSFSPVIIPLGAHSDALDTYGGGPGTVALHGWTDPSVFGQALSHGCIRVPDDALDQLRSLPLGTPIMIDAS